MKTSEFANMAAADIASNGFKILSRPKYQGIIDTTVIFTLPNKFNFIGWYDRKGAEVSLSMVMILDDSRPKVGKIVYADWPQDYQALESLNDLLEGVEE